MANGNPPEHRDNEPVVPVRETPVPRDSAGGGSDMPVAPAPSRERRPVQFDPNAPMPPVQGHGPGRIRHGFRLRYLALIAAVLAGGYYLYDKLQHDAFLTAVGAEEKAKTKAMENATPDNQLSLSGKVERKGNELLITLDEANSPVDQSGEYFPVSLSIERYFNNGRLLSAEIIAKVDRSKIGAAPVRYSFRGDNLISVDVTSGTGQRQWDATGKLLRK